MADRKFRVVLIVPANNTTMEPEITGYCPEIGELRMARVPRPPRPLEPEERAPGAEKGPPPDKQRGHKGQKKVKPPTEPVPYEKM
mgnify:CR=1 FL=1